VSFPSVIPTASLKLDDVPLPESKWAKIAAFALTFDPREMGEYAQQAAELDNVSLNSSVMELRAHLYVEQRRWNHFGEEPSATELKKLREILSLIRQKLAQSS
jgi:hypothetical protein